MNSNWKLHIINFLKKFFIILSCLTPLLFFFPQEFGIVWVISWYALVFVMLIRPVSNICPKISILKKLIPLRKEIWIFAAMTTIMHWLLVFKAYNMPLIVSFFDFTWLSITNHMFFAKLWVIIALILLITSNKWSVTILKQKWKWVQRFAYAYFFAAWIHIFLIWKWQSLWALVIMILLIIFWALAKCKIRIYK